MNRRQASSALAFRSGRRMLRSAAVTLPGTGAALAQQRRSLDLQLLGFALGIHAPATAAFMSILPAMPGYATPVTARLSEIRMVTQTMIGGSADIGESDPPTVLAAAEAGARFKIVGNPYDSAIVFVVNGDRVKTINDLAKPETRVAIGARGDIKHVIPGGAAVEARHRPRMARVDAMPGHHASVASYALIMVGLLVAADAGAAEITVAGLFTNKAVVQIDGGPLRTLSVGQKTAEGVVLLSVERDVATFDVDGKRITLGLGRARMATTAPAVESAVLTADLQGHFKTDGQVNGRTIRFVVDTGATLIALPASEARRIAIDYRKGEKAMMGTANGNVPGYLIKLDTVSIGSVTLYGVDAVVIEGNGLASPLLGMSFLNRMNMQRDGDIMTLTRRY